jgi:hypothetical protein
MIGHYTGITRSARCHCGHNGLQRQLHIEGKAIALRGSKDARLKVWIMAEHKTACGAICSPAHAGACPVCPTQSAARRPPRPRHKSEVTASAILGQLSASELRVLHTMLYMGVKDMRVLPNQPGWLWLRTLDIKNTVGLRDATVRDSLRRLAARGVAIQNRNTRRWRVNLPDGMRSLAE